MPGGAMPVRSSRTDWQSVKIPRDPSELGKLLGQVLQSIDDQVNHAVLPLQETAWR